MKKNNDTKLTGFIGILTLAAGLSLVGACGGEGGAQIDGEGESVAVVDNESGLEAVDLTAPDGDFSEEARACRQAARSIPNMSRATGDAELAAAEAGTDGFGGCCRVCGFSEETEYFECYLECINGSQNPPPSACQTTCCIEVCGSTCCYFC